MPISRVYFPAIRTRQFARATILAKRHANENRIACNARDLSRGLGELGDMLQHLRTQDAIEGSIRKRKIRHARFGHVNTIVVQFPRRQVHRDNVVEKIGEKLSVVALARSYFQDASASLGQKPYQIVCPKVLLRALSVGSEIQFFPRWIERRSRRARTARAEEILLSRMQLRGLPHRHESPHLTVEG